MKRLLTFIYLLSISSTILASELVPVVWPFALGNNQSNIVRTLIDNANKNQNKYQFIFVSKQGAGGAIAANTVLAGKTMIFANSSSFYLTPLFNKDAYDVDQFNILSRMCVDRPLVLFSKSFTKLEPNKELTVSMTPATIQALVPRVISQKNSSFKYLEVPFKSGPDGTLAMLSGVVDASVDWLGAYSSVVAPGNGVNVVGITGNRRINNLPLLPGTELLVGDVFLFIPTTVDSKTYRELYDIFNDAQNETSDMLCKNDFGRPIKTDLVSFERIHNDNKVKWKKFISPN
jgi:tripartite-type tricarboxylate transporter receptor subunit TctC